MEHCTPLRLCCGGSSQALCPVLLSGADGPVLIDCGYPGSLEELEAQLRAHGTELRALSALVLTHQDDDHMGAAAELKERHPALRILASAREAPYISGREKNLRLRQAEALQPQLPPESQDWGRAFCRRLSALRPVPVDELLRPGDRFDWGGGCQILATPGHTPGHISIRSTEDEFLITGDAAVLEEGRLALANPGFCLDLPEAERSLALLKRSHCRRIICYHGGEWIQEVSP